MIIRKLLDREDGIYIDIYFINPAKRRAVIQAGNLRSRCSQIFLRLQAANPHPTTELEYATPFELLVAVALSAHALN